LKRQEGYPLFSFTRKVLKDINMLKGVGAFTGMALLLLAAGCMAGYIYGGVQWSTYRALDRAVSAFWWASGALLVAGIVYRIAFKRFSSVCGVLFIVAITVALMLTGFHYAVGGNTWWR
jgi:hypothetical protein